MAVLLHLRLGYFKNTILNGTHRTSPPYKMWLWKATERVCICACVCVFACVFSCSSPSPFCSFWPSMAVPHQGNCQCPHPFHRCSRHQPSRPHTVKRKPVKSPGTEPGWEDGAYKGLCSRTQAQREGPEPGGFVGRTLKLLSCVLNIIV